jgi:flagellar motor switch protein FliG
MSAFDQDLEIPSIDGPDKAALWILSADADVAANVVSQLDARELKMLREAVQRVQKARPEMLHAVHAELLATLDRPQLSLRGREDYLKQLAEKAGSSAAADVFGDKKPAAVAEKPKAPTIADADPEALAAILEDEHPQVVAAVLARLDPKRAAKVLKHMATDTMTNIVARLAKITAIAEPALEQAEKLLIEQLPQASGPDVAFDGTRIAALLLNQLGPENADKVLATVGESTPEIAAKVRRAMFTFDDLAKLDKRGMQTLLKSVDNAQLLVAMKTSSEELRGKIYDSMSKRAAEMLKDDLELLGPQRVSDVEAAQEAVVGVAMQLRQDGKLTIDMGDGEAMT